MPQSKSNSSEPHSDNPQAGQVSSGQIISGPAAYTQCLLTLIASARREITLLSNSLEARLYNREDVALALKDFILISPHSRLRILLRDDSGAARGHRIVDLGQRLSSYVDFRVLSEHHRATRTGWPEWAIIDEQQFLERRAPAQLNAYWHPGEPALARLKRKQFDTWWQAGEPASRLRALHLG